MDHCSEESSGSSTWHLSTTVPPATTVSSDVVGWLTARKRGELREGASGPHPQIWAPYPSYGLLSSAHPSQPAFPSRRRRRQAAQGQRGAAGGSDNPSCPKDGYFGTAAAPCCPTGKGDVSLPSLEVRRNLHPMLDVGLCRALSYISALVFRAQAQGCPVSNPHFTAPFPRAILAGWEQLPLAEAD